jgi:hypothetical protein
MARRVLVEVKIDRGVSPEVVLARARAWAQYGFVVDEAYRAVPMEEGSVMIRGTLRDDADEAALKNQPQVVGVWEDGPIAPASE